MKNTLSLLALTLTSLSLVGCGQPPMTDADMAKQYGFSVEEFQEQKEAAARMNMTIEDHLNMSGDMSSEMDPSAMNHTMPDGEIMANDEMDLHEKAAADMGMTLQEHVDAGHPGH